MFVTNPRAIIRDSLQPYTTFKGHPPNTEVHTTTHVKTEAARALPVHTRYTIFKVVRAKLPKWLRVEPENVVGDPLPETPKKYKARHTLNNAVNTIQLMLF